MLSHPNIFLNRSKHLLVTINQILFLFTKINFFTILIEEMLDEVSEMKEDDLETIKESVENDLREQPHSIS